MEYYKDYEELEAFLIEELDKFSHGQLKPFCLKNNLPVSEVYRFRNRKLPTTRPFFLQEILTALGYSKIEVQPKIFFHFTRNEEEKINENTEVSKG